MGFSESKDENTKTEYCITDFKPLSSGHWLIETGRRIRKSLHLQNTSSYILNATIDSSPNFQELTFQCSICRHICFDAGLNKIIRCKCKNFISRDNKNKCQVTSLKTEAKFERSFEEHTNLPSSNFVPELLSLTLGIFRDGLSPDYIINGRAIFSDIFDIYLSPFFKEKLRCLGIGDYFKYNEARFKVIGSFPSYGIITEKTLISCSEVLSMNPIERVQILPIAPNKFVESEFTQTIQPYFKSITRHVMSGDYLYIDSKSYIISACQPTDGIINSETSFYFNGEPLEPIYSFTIVPYFEDLPYRFYELNRDQLIEEILNIYIMNYFQGFKRIISLDEIISIDGVAFQIVDCWPNKGITIDSTIIVYQQLLQIQQMMMDIGVTNMTGTSPETIQSLPTKKVESLAEDPEASKCMVCLSSYEIGDDTTILFCCKLYLVHAFHSICIREWLKRSTFCPLCKFSLE